MPHEKDDHGTPIAPPPTDGATAVAGATRAAEADVLQLTQWDEGETLHQLGGDYPNIWIFILGMLDLIERGIWTESFFWEYVASSDRPYPIDYFRKHDKAVPNVAPDSKAQQLMDAFIPLIDALKAAIAAKNKDRVVTAFNALETLKRTIPSSDQDPTIRWPGTPLPTTA